MKLLLRFFVVVVVLAIGAGLVAAVVVEADKSIAQSRVLSRYAQTMTFDMEAGAPAATLMPNSGPYDQRLGYAGLPDYVSRLTAHGYRIAAQATPSPSLSRFVAGGGYAVYNEKDQAGLRIHDRDMRSVYARIYPENAYPDFPSIPRLISETLLHIEDRRLLAEDLPNLNPAVDWDRFLAAAASRLPFAGEVFGVKGGASTIATQLEKFRHSPGGRTAGPADKLRQMASASMRAYRDGPDTTAARQGVLVAYLNSTPLGSRPGYGEIIGIADGLKVWYGTDFSAANQTLRAEVKTAADIKRKATTYKQVLSLLIAQRRPAFYLNADLNELDALTNFYLADLRTAGVIDDRLYQDAREIRLAVRPRPPMPSAVHFTERKAADLVRTELLSKLGVSSLYELDRMDIVVESTIDQPAQTEVSSVLTRLADRNEAAKLGFVGHHMLNAADPAKVAYSVVLYERGADHHAVRVHADSLNQPFNLNSGAKLILGSTAKLRTTVTYLNVIEQLHHDFGSLPANVLWKRFTARSDWARRDPLTGWALTYLASSQDRSLGAMIDAAMDRRYSANPSESFFTGGGRHRFGNFTSDDNGRVATVAESLRHSINLPFIRIMRDIVRYHMARDGSEASVDNAARRAYLKRFADREGTAYLDRFYADYRDLSSRAIVERVFARARQTPVALSAVHRFIQPEADASDLQRLLNKRLTKKSVGPAEAATLHDKYRRDAYGLNDRAFLAKIHPLELWLAAYLLEHPKAPRSQVMAAASQARQDAYQWLFKTKHQRRQDLRIGILREEDAFARILEDWRKQGFPFAQMTPSYASAIGSSGDRPDALAKLMGIIINGGLDAPAATIERISFATGTPFETRLELDRAATPQRVLSPEVADTLHRALLSVVEGGTAVRLHRVFRDKNGNDLAVGGKTGTGDNRTKSYSRGGGLKASTPVDRTATFVFFIDDKIFGTITAYVPGPDAGQYRFTSSLATQLLKVLAPTIQKLLDEPAATDLARQTAPGVPAADATPVVGVAFPEAATLPN